MIGVIKRPQMFKKGEILFTKMINAAGNQAFFPRKPNISDLPIGVRGRLRVRVFHSEHAL